MVEKALKVEMFGGFEVMYGEEPVVTKENRNSKVLMLFQYLLCNRNRMVAQDELIHVLLNDEECENPVGTLKNLVYRLRKQLEACGVERECIGYRRGAYGFTGEMPLVIDQEVFASITAQIAEGKLADDAVFEKCLQAIELYKTGFLPKTMGEPWAMGFAVKMQEKYCDCFRTAYRIAARTKQYDKLVDKLCEAVSVYPYEEDLTLMYIKCLYEMNRVKEAMEVYEATTTRLFDDLGIGPSENMKEMFGHISGSKKEVNLSIDDVRSEIRETEYENGAFYCNLEVFESLYRFVVRHMERSGQSVFLMLCTITDLNGAKPGNNEKTKKIIDDMQQAIKASLRRGDAYTRYSPTQYLVMLMEIKQENCNIVADRLRYHFYKTSKRNNEMRFVCKSISAADMDSIMVGEEAQKALWNKEKKD
ncbi:MAG: BTAD domain-containing putative transcriptional regulator [Christensenella sp.]|uniref:AfsR/SARP family transcriptional regulator n=1 Tax=Christensenella sp. TaxID=1935934 RepID=UPI002B215261|nr:BTAD domain-containing putative transcriptional regulator [Christensenella sp.]MEA5002669.1 BTAD domain-containing putative transcriptional regulator [Christensenella sp.]